MSPGDTGPIDPRVLMQSILAVLESAMAATGSLATDGEPGRCTQAWCPFCAVAAGVAGERHPLLTMISEHGSSLVALLKTMAAETPSATGPAAEDADRGPGHYQHIPVTVHE